MIDDGWDIAEDSWAFALKLYAKPGISEACLALQSRAGVDVMLLLVAIFAASQRRLFLTPSDIDDLDAACRSWREQVVHPLRAIRTALKVGPSPAPSVATETLRSQIKANELAAERIENNLLAGQLLLRMPGASTLSRDDIESVVRDVVRHAMGRQHRHSIDEYAPVIEVLVSSTDKMMR